MAVGSLTEFEWSSLTNETPTYESYTSDVNFTSTPTSEGETIQWSVNNTLSYFYFFVGGIGLLGNTFVVLVIFSLTSMRKDVTNMFIINQSIIDWLTVCLLILGILFGEDGTLLSGIMGELYCRLWLNKAIQWCTQLASTYNLLALTFERYIAVVYPIRYKTFFSQGKAGIAIAMVWIFSFFMQLCIAVPPAGLLDGKCNLLRFWPSHQFQRGIGVFAIVIKYIIPISVMTFCYSKMIIVLKIRVQPVSNDAVDIDTVVIRQNTSTDKREKARRNIFKTLAIVTICFAACWTCNQIYFLMFNFGYNFKNVFTNPFYHFTVMLVYINSVINPFIYIAKYEKFQKGILKLKNKMLGRKDTRIKSDEKGTRSAQGTNQASLAFVTGINET